MGKINQRTIAIYRALLENVSGETFLSPFVNFVAMSIYDDRENVYTPEELIDKVYESYGISIPLLPMKKIVGMLIKRNMLKYMHNNKYRVEDREGFFNKYEKIRKTKENIESSYDDLVNSCYEYLKDKFDYNENQAETEKLLQTFINYQIEKIDGQSKDILYGFTSSIDKNQKMYFIGTYIKEKCIGNEKENLIKKILVGGLLVESIVIKQTYKTPMLNGIKIVLDTPIIFQLLGINIIDMRDVYCDMVEQINKLGGAVYVFNRSIEEVEQILRNAESMINSPYYDYAKASSALVYYKENGKSKEDISFDCIMLRTTLKNMNIDILNIEYAEKDHQNNESEQEIFEEIIGVYNDKNNTHSLKDTVMRDASSINDIFLCRKGIRPTTVFDCKAILVTTNYSLVYAAVKYNEKRYNVKNIFPTCITDVFLGTALWLSDTIKLESMSFKRLMAQVYSIFQPKDDFWNCFLSKIQSLESKGELTEDQSILLRSVTVTGKLLLDTTYADLKNISEETVFQVFARLKEENRQSGYQEGQRNTESKFEEKLSEQEKKYQENILKLDEEHKKKELEIKENLKKSIEQQRVREQVKKRCKNKIKYYTIFILLVLIISMMVIGYHSYFAANIEWYNIGLLCLLIFVIINILSFKHSRKNRDIQKILEALKMDKLYNLYWYFIKRLIKREFAKEKFL